MFDKRWNCYSAAGGKIDKWEDIESGLKREVKEEIWVDIISMKRLWNINDLRSGWAVCHVFFEVKIDGTPKIKEKEKFSDIIWVKSIVNNCRCKS